LSKFPNILFVDDVIYIHSHSISKSTFEILFLREHGALRQSAKKTVLSSIHNIYHTTCTLNVPSHELGCENKKLDLKIGNKNEKSEILTEINAAVPEAFFNNTEHGALCCTFPTDPKRMYLLRTSHNRSSNFQMLVPL